MAGRLDNLRKQAAAVSLYVATYSPGDGVTRYRFIKSRGGKPVSYFSQDGVYTAPGIKEAETFVRGRKSRR